MTEEIVQAYVPDEIKANFPSYVKVLQLGDPRISDILKRPHVVEEKLDGSQFRFGKIGGQVMTGSHRVRYNEYNQPDKMFRGVVAYVESIASLLPEGTMFYAEMLSKPKQNTVQYGRAAKNGLMLFDAWDTRTNTWFTLPELTAAASLFEIDGPVILAESDGSEPESLDTMQRFLSTTSYFGNSIIEGIVVKCYGDSIPVTYQQLPGLFGKYVRASFKEENAIEWRGKKGSVTDAVISRFKTEARWEKIVLHLQEEGKLEWNMRDMGALITELSREIEEEVKPAAVDMLWGNIEHQVHKGLGGGMAEWWKAKLLKKQVEEDK
jgi:RNA ligase